MGRSIKHTPRCGQRKCRYAKRCAARAVRRTRPLAGQGRGSYKKLYEYWNICDYEDVGTTFRQWWEHVRSCAAPGERPDRLAAWRDYQRWYVRK